MNDLLYSRYFKLFLLYLNITAVFLLPFLSEAQSFKLVYPKDGTHLTLPFTYTNGFIIVDVILEKTLPLKFIVDTGASHTLLLKKEYIEIFNIPIQRKLSVQGADLTEYMSASIYNSVYLKVSEMPHLSLNIIALDEDYTQFEYLTGIHIAGILGADYFRNMILGIDYKRNQMIIYNPNSFSVDKLRKFSAFNINLVNSKPYIVTITEIIPNRKIETNLLIDTGASLGLLLHQNTDSIITIPDKNVLSVLGKGLGGDILGYTSRIHKIQIGELYFENVLTNFQSIDTALVDLKKITRNGIIGSHLLDRFHMIIDFRWQKMYLKPYKNYNKSIEYDKSGLSIITFGPKLDKFFVRYVVENSSSHKADIRPGDVILKIGRISSWRYSLDRFTRKLSGKEGKIIKLTILRDDIILKKTIVLRSYI